MDILPAPNRVGTYLKFVDGVFIAESTSARIGFACTFFACDCRVCRRFFGSIFEKKEKIRLE